MKTLRFFTLSAAALLLASGLMHMLNAAGHAQALALPDPLLGLPLRYGLLGAGALEIAVALICLLGKRPGLQLLWLAWMGTNLLVYRLGLIWSGCSVQCTCLGNPTDPLHLSRAAAAFLLNFPPLYLVLGSSAALLLHWLYSRRNPLVHESTTPSEKMSCPGCGRHIRFAVQDIGQNIPCPQCKTTVTLRRPGTLKTECYFCKGHVEFPAHALGEKIHCPHCQMDITLKEPA